MKESMNAYKSQTDASINSLRLEMNQNKEEGKNKEGDLSLEIRSVASSLDECNSNNHIQTDRQIYLLEIQKLNSEARHLKVKLNSNQANQTASAVSTSTQASTTALIGTGKPTSQVRPAVSESGSCISPGVNGVLATCLHATT
jgi:hypothetical protein